MAAREKLVYLHRWMTEFATQRAAGAAGSPVSADAATEFRRALRDSGDDEHTADVLESLAQDKAEAMVSKAVAAGSPEAEAFTKAKAWYDLATAKGPTLREAWEEWMRTCGLPEQTRSAYTSHFDEFLRWRGVHDDVAAKIDGKVARAFASHLNEKARSSRPPHGPLSHKSKATRIAALSAFWQKHLSYHEIVADGVNPWRGLKLTRRGAEEGAGGANADAGLRPYTPDELVRLFDKSPEAPRRGPRGSFTRTTMQEVLALLLFTGLRIEELTVRTVGDVEPLGGVEAVQGGEGGKPTGAVPGYVIHVRSGKTKAAKRSIPVVHPIPVAILKRRIGERTEGPLLVECKPATWGRTATNLGKALGHYRDHLGMGPEVTTHSTRKNFTSVMEAKDVNPIWLKRYIGHALADITFGLYSRGEASSLRAIAEAVSYPVPVEAAMRQALAL